MPNDKPLYLITGPKSLLEAANKEVEKTSLRTTKPSGWHDILYVSPHTRQSWWACMADNFSRYTLLTLPQDWDQLMAILEELKQPKVLEYVRGGITGKHFKVYGQEDRNYLVYGVKGTSQYMAKECAQPITEEEFIQGGLKELEEAGFVVGAKVEVLYVLTHGNLTKTSQFTIQEIDYQKNTTQDTHNSPLTDEEVQAKGFCFRVRGDGHAAPPALSTLLPKAQTLPTTSQGIPYKMGYFVVSFGEAGNVSLLLHTLKDLLDCGVTSITLPCGTLTAEDLLTLSSQ